MANRKTVETVADFIFGGSKIRVTVAMKLKDTCSLEEKLMTNLDSILKSRAITLPTKVHVVKAMVFPVVMYGCESWTIKKTEHWRTDAFELWCWRLLRVSWTARRSNQSILKEISPTSPGLKEIRPVFIGIHWKDWCWSQNSNTLDTWCEELTYLKRVWCWERLKTGEEGDDRGWDGWMASPTGWTWVWIHSRSWWWTGRPGTVLGVAESDMPKWLNWIELNFEHVKAKRWDKIAH